MDSFRAEATALAERAVRRLGERHDLWRVTHLLIVTNTGFFAPGIDYRIIERFQLDRRVVRLQLGFTGAAAGVEALVVARQVLAAVPESVVLIVVVEVPSLHVTPAACTGALGDGAAAALLSGESSGMALVESGQTLVPGTRDALSMSVGEHGFGFAVSERAVDAIRVQLPRVAGPRDLAASFRNRAVIVNCASPELADVVADVLGIGAEQRRLETKVAGEAGNLLSAASLFAFERVLAGSEGVARVATLGVAPGLGLHWCLADVPA